MVDIDRKRVTLHPLKPDGSIELSVEVYPKTFIDGVVDRNGNEVAIQEKLIAGQNIVINGNTISSEGGVSEAELELVRADLQIEINRVESEITDSATKAELAEAKVELEEELSTKQQALVAEEDSGIILTNSSSSTDIKVDRTYIVNIVNEIVGDALDDEYGYDEPIEIPEVMH